MTNAGLFTNEGNAVPLDGVEVEGEVLGAHARVKVRQRYRNREARPIEAVYTFPLPSEATLIGFAMSAAGRRLEGVVKEREQAFRDYDDAVWAGHGAALLDQERTNVFTAQVGNLLPGEETTLEIEYLERLQADEGALRWMIPTLVAPRYIPGVPSGDRSGHGRAEPTDRVPDADRVTPPIGEVGYGLKLDLTFALGRPVAVECPSHAVSVRTEAGRTHVTFQSGQVALDRDVVVIARGLAEGPLATVLAHHPATGPGYFSLTVVPDLTAGRPRASRHDVVFVIDTSGSMEGASLPEAQAALRLCLRHLREGDHFNVIAFNSTMQSFQPRPVPFNQRTLEAADRWVGALVATGDTELQSPMLAAVGQVPDGVVVLLTDGQVGNEQEILTAVLAARGRARIYPFGIGTNVSDGLLRDLARRSGGAVELIHPGERIDEKVVAQFARAIAARVTDVAVRFTGIEAGDLAPAELPALVDGEPWSLFGTLEAGGRGTAVVTGTLDGQPFRLEVPLDLAASSAHPAIGKLWAKERIRGLAEAAVTGRRGERMRERIVELAVAHGVSSAYTSFVVVETRSGERRVAGQPETRVVPVSLPAGWDGFRRTRLAPPAPAQTMMAPMSSMAGGPARGRSGGIPQPIPPSAPRVSAAAPAAASEGGSLFGRALGAVTGAFKHEREDGVRAKAAATGRAQGIDPVVALLSEQLASGLWAGAQDRDVDRLRATARALLVLCDAGVTTTHALHAAQIKKAVAALIQLAIAVAVADPAAAELALGVAWLVASGQRTRKEIETALTHASLASLKPRLADARTLRAHLDSL